MTITIKIDTGNAAFDENKIAEVERIIREWLDGGGVYAQPKLYDVNGNHVGSVKVSGK